MNDSATVRAAFATRLKEERVRSGFLKPSDLAEALEMDEVRYTRWERGEVDPGLGNLVRICKVLKITPNDLLGF